MKTLRNLFMWLIVMSIGLTGCANRATTDSERMGSQDVVVVQPNQTAFQIPAVGGNLSGQAQFQSIGYLESKKVAAKRLTIDKELVGGKYIGTTIVVLVDRTPVARQWTDELSTGTTARDEALCAESSESIGVCFPISLAAVVQEQNAATYLYNYPTAKLQDDQVGGVFIATPLSSVVDVQIHQYLQKVISNESATRTLAQIIADKADIIKAAETSTIEMFQTQGVTVSYVGLGGGLTLDPKIQSVIDQLYISERNLEVMSLAATQTIINANADAEAAKIRASADAVALGELVKATGGDPAALAAALESYRWNGSRVTVMLSPDTAPAVVVPPVATSVSPTSTSASPATP